MGTAQRAPAAAEGAAKSPPACRCAGDHGPNVERIKQALAESLKSSGLEFTDEPLENVVNFLQDEYGIPIQLDVPALEGAGLTADEPMTVNLQNISLRSAIRLLLKPKNLTYIIRNEVLIITTPEVAEHELVVCVYEVRDLVTVFPRRAKTKGDKSATADFDSLIDAITSCVHTETWSENGGGEANIRPLPSSGLLIVSQTQAVHEGIADLLSVIRATLRQPTQPSAGEGMGMMMGGRGEGGYGMGMGGGRGYGGGYGEYGGRRGEMGREPTPAEDSPFE